MRQCHSVCHKSCKDCFVTKCSICSEKQVTNCLGHCMATVHLNTFNNVFQNSFIGTELTCRGFHMSILRRTRGPSTLGKQRLMYASRYASASVLRQLSNRDATPRMEQNSSTTSENTRRASDSIVSVNNRENSSNIPKKSTA